MFLCLSLKSSFQLLKPGLITFLRVEMLFLNQFSISKGHFPVVYSENFYQGRHAGDLFCNAREIKEKNAFPKGNQTPDLMNFALHSSALPLTQR